MQPIDRCLAALSARGCDPRQTREGRSTAKCPGHEDTKPSLSVGPGRDARVLLHCFAGCSLDRILAGLGLKPSDLFAEQTTAPMAGRRGRVTEYEIRGTDAAIEAWHVRTDCGDGTKHFGWRSPGDSKGLGGRRVDTLPLYGFERLNDLPDGTRVFLVEGEKACDALLERGYLAFATVTGSAGTPSADVLRQLARLDVTLWPDNDDTGRAHMGRCGAVLVAAGGKARNLNWPTAPPKSDAFDFFAAGYTAEQLDALVHDAKPASAAAPVPCDGRQPALVCMADVMPESVRWLLYPYIAFGKLTILDGDPETGKTTIVLSIAAALSTGGPLPGEIPTMRREPVDVLLMSAEDGPGDTLRPRLDAMGADPKRIHLLPGRLEPDGSVAPISLADVDVIAAAIRKTGARLVAIDPLLAYLGADVDLHRSNETRPVLAAVARVGEETGAAMLGLRHLRKTPGRALYSGLGSIDITAAARSVLLAARHTEDENVRVLAHAKSSLAPRGPSLTYTLAGGGLTWTGTCDLTADDLCQGGGESPGETRRAAVAFLLAALAAGPQSVADLRQRAAAAGLSWRTVERAKAELGVVSFRGGGIADQGAWFWRLPDQPEGSASV